MRREQTPKLATTAMVDYLEWLDRQPEYEPHIIRTKSVLDFARRDHQCQTVVPHQLSLSEMSLSLSIYHPYVCHVMFFSILFWGVVW